MKIRRTIALMLAMLMLATFAVAETADDPIVVKAGEIELPLSDVQSFFDYYYEQNMQYYAESGMTLSQEEIDWLLDAVIEALAQNAVMDNKIAELGLDVITDEEKATLHEEAEISFEESLAAYAESMGLSLEEAREDVANQGIDAEVMYESNLLDVPYMRLQDSVVGDITVSDEEVKAEFDAYVERDKESYATDVSSYEMYTTYYGAQGLYYTPEGYRLVKHILLAVPEDIQTQINDLQTEQQAIQSVINSLSEELYALENNTEDEAAPAEEAAETETAETAETEATEETAETTETTETDDSARTAEAIQADLDEQNEKIADVTAKIEEAREQILPSLSETIEEINAKLEAGESFDVLIEEYNTDPGMASNPDGYQVHKDSIVWETRFQEAARALKAIGDVSDPVLTDYGVHIIQYAADAPGGAVEMTDELADEIRATLLTTKQEEAFTKAFEEWQAEVEVETHPELVKLPEVAETAEAEATTEPAEDEAATGDETEVTGETEESGAEETEEEKDAE